VLQLASSALVQRSFVALSSWWVQTLFIALRRSDLLVGCSPLFASSEDHKKLSLVIV